MSNIDNMGATVDLSILNMCFKVRFENLCLWLLQISDLRTVSNVRVS